MSEVSQQTPEDSALIAQAQAGDISAFGDLYQRYQEVIYRYVLARVPDATTAEDLTEVVFLNAYEALDRYEDRGAPYTAFLYRVARNLITDFYRKRKEEVSLEAVSGQVSEVVQLDEKMVRREGHKELREALEGLREDYREVIRLRVILELSTTEVADWMDRSEGAVRVLLHRALNALRETMDEENHR